MDLLSISIGIGLGISLFFSEFFGIAGGLVVPGYFALQLQNPVNILLTLSVSLGVFGLGKFISKFVILYGKRRTAILLLLGFVLDAVGNEWIFPRIFTEVVQLESEVRAVGHIIPGLIAVWMDRQGWLETLASLLTASVIVRLILILFLGKELLP
ncbi:MULTISPECIES: poly-gamma-glutamate biosynthesis protein PgsC [unclassified Leptospira]|jgi:gamma-polyglutamate biosynthesis protein CapC|uniref:poly-gamma-glutamate biosynthesis protein PgsC n=1 Tax=unclassified Leptospira TaxID=2633828 RepID=UPI0002BEA718|nr:MULTISPECIES: poly-gamma-glutamate biosynthesis protein PgsC [unclassified Leptospira]EMK01637.1 poly-gamma-glutamate biosynthesis protein PgsC [Leptospira sp. B5-022]MCR1793390.1 poly-gamma-glutamate biosynthesis protein PgsC [Leptospira sp. id769339]